MSRLTTTLKATLGLLTVMLAGGSLLSAAELQGAEPIPSHDSYYPRLLDRYCTTCHNEQSRVGGLALSALDITKAKQAPETWEKVVKKLRTGAMPPAGMPRPDKTTYDSLATYLEVQLDQAAAADPNPGRPSIHRLNRFEYANAVHDLLAVEIDEETLLPADDSRHGFDNIGDVLSVSPLLLERYMSAARKVTRLAIGDWDASPVSETYRVPKYNIQDDRMNDSLPFGTRGGIAVRHHFPLDGEYIIKVSLGRDSRDYIRGLTQSHQLDVSLNNVRIKRFTFGGEIHGQSASIFSSATMGDPAQETYERTADKILEVRFPAKAGTRLVGATFLKETRMSEGPKLPTMTMYDWQQYKGGNPLVANITISGPYNAQGLGETASRRKVFVCNPNSIEEEDPCARKILSTLARRAYRRALTDEDLHILFDFYETGRREKGFEAGIGTALERILVGPEFLFRIEPDPEKIPPDTAYRIGDVELATRLSFFLWSSLPDNQLLDLAEQDRLKDPQVLEQEVRRLLTDSRSRALVTNFGSQWLFLRNLNAVRPDPQIFPYFNDNLREAFRLETELFFESLLREDRSLLDLLDANHTFVNERLARHYGIPNIYGSHFRRVELTQEERRGLLGKGSLLTVTSYANRTSPVLRGKWVLDHILGSPPAPPPANIPELQERDESGKVLSMRQQMEQHRANPACATCHSQMDPLGFALENFDGIGTWRTMDAGAPIDPSGVLPDGTSFQGPVELQKALHEKGREFIVTTTEKLLTYALGRGLESYDAPAVRGIIREAASNNYRWSSLILNIVRSTPFQMRRSQKP
ncbi:MAG: DUF1592 domain-containing protein [Acidobacteriota bacterium]|nr:DUF1592 domain-containing protein [Acidobacteriota bacterium]